MPLQRSHSSWFRTTTNVTTVVVCFSINLLPKSNFTRPAYTAPPQFPRTLHNKLVVTKEVPTGTLRKASSISSFVNPFFSKNERLCTMGDDLTLGWERKLTALITWSSRTGWGLGSHGSVFGLFSTAFDSVTPFASVPTAQPSKRDE